MDIPSVVDLINANSKKTETASAEIAAVTVRQQQMMENEGELQPVTLRGPNGTFIPAYFSKAENAFLPKFQID